MSIPRGTHSQTEIKLGYFVTHKVIMFDAHADGMSARKLRMHHVHQLLPAWWWCTAERPTGLSGAFLEREIGQSVRRPTFALKSCQKWFWRVPAS